jgi:hypothetical protein
MEHVIIPANEDVLRKHFSDKGQINCEMNYRISIHLLNCNRVFYINQN